MRLGERFNLVVLTGHAFQVFLTEEDQRAILDTIARHLAPGGRFVFDSRAPEHEAWRRRTPESTRRRLEHPTLGPVEEWNDAALADEADGIVVYRTHYALIGSGERFEAASRLRFTPKAVIERLIADAGLHVERWLGDWGGRPWTPEADEIIPLGRFGS